jgi:hypothetical protein
MILNWHFMQGKGLFRAKGALLSGGLSLPAPAVDGYNLSKI